MNTKKYALKKTIGGISIMSSVLLLLIGLTKYDQIFSSTKYDLNRSLEYAKTALVKNSSSSQKKLIEKIDLESEGEIVKTTPTVDGELTKHYRAIYVPELVNNYDYLPRLYLEIMDNDSIKWIEEKVYKVNREKGLVYFLLKSEKNNQIVPNNLYTGNYKIDLIK